MKIGTRQLWKRVHELERYLKAAQEFNMVPQVFVPFGTDHGASLTDGFVPVCQYGRGMPMLRGEIGTNGRVRFVQWAHAK